MVHPYTNQKLETFTISPIVHASKMYPTALSVLTNTRPAANSEHQERSLFLKSPTDPLCNQIITICHYRNHLQSNKVTAVFILNSFQFKKNLQSDTEG